MINLSKLVFFYSKPLDNQKVYHIVRCEGHLATYILMIYTLLRRITILICPHQWTSHHLTRMLPAIWSLNQHFINNLLLNTSYPLVNVNKKLWNITIFHGKTHYFYGHSQCRKLWLFTRGYGYMYHKCTIISYYKPSLSLYSGTIFQRVQIARGGRVPCRSPWEVPHNGECRDAAAARSGGRAGKNAGNW